MKPSLFIIVAVLLTGFAFASKALIVDLMRQKKYKPIKYMPRPVNLNPNFYTKDGKLVRLTYSKGHWSSGQDARLSREKSGVQIPYAPPKKEVK